jgi:hypothetical protein
MPRRNTALSATGVVLLTGIVCALIVAMRDPAARAQTAVNVNANVAPESQHYEQGEINWAFSSQGGFRTLRLSGKMDVTLGPIYIQVKTNQGTTVFLRENLRYCSSLTQTPEAGNE